MEAQPPGRQTVVVHDVLRRSLEPVLHDIGVSGAPMPEIRDDDCTGDRQTASAMLWDGDGSGAGITVTRTALEADRVASVADQVQEWVIEQVAATNWTACPDHPDTHPLAATVRHSVAVWTCPGSGRPVSPVGALV